jgi:hypothetical protein
MKAGILLMVLCVLFFSGRAQNNQPFIIPETSLLSLVKTGDSIIYYQGHVAEPAKEAHLSSDQPDTLSLKPFTLSDKFVITRKGADYLLTHYTATLQVFPNHRFSGLKVREKSYWGFAKKQSVVLNQDNLELLVLLEKKGREAMEYDYPLTRYTRNQLIIKYGKNFKQLVIDRGWLITSMLPSG